MKVLMLAQSPVAGDSRIIREADTLADAGHDIHILGRDVPEGFDLGSKVSVSSITRSRGLRPNQAAGASVQEAPQRGIGALVRRVGRWLLLPEHRARTERKWREAARVSLAQHEPYDVVHAHDFNTLELGVELAERWQAKLVYDTHELWFGRALPGRPTPLARWRGRRSEAALAQHASAVVTVSDGIVGRLQAAGFPHVRLVRNTFPLGDDPAPVLAERPHGVVYAGRIGSGRDLETVVSAAADLKPLSSVLVGPADPSYHVDPSGLDIRPPLSLDGVDALYQEFGIAVITLTDTCDNHRLALPNKLFHAVHAGVPVVAADLPQMRSLVSDYRIGCMYRPGDAASFVRAVREVADNYAHFGAAVAKARTELSWEHDARVLRSVYEDLGAS